MSRDIYNEIYFERLIHTFIFQCAPVVAGLKPSNLLIIRRRMRRGAYKIAELCSLSVMVLYEDGEKLYLLVYNPSALKVSLAKPGVSRFLTRRGYKAGSLDKLFSQISERYSKYMKEHGSFPHELGIVLGYPLEDVYGYMLNEGRDFILNGYWKVYSDIDGAREVFRRYDEVTEDMMRCLLSGENLNDIVRRYKVA